MSPEAQRIAIAEACGWTACGFIEGCEPHGYPPKAKKPTVRELLDGDGPTPWDIPDYLNDLNAMHEAEKVLSEKERLRYLVKLVPIVGATRDSNIAGNINAAIFATAAQRAEAFLRALNLWTE